MAAIVVAAVFAVSLVYIYEEDVKAYALEEITKTLKTDVKVSSVDLTLIDQFPSASLQFNNVLIEETFSQKDTLIFAEYLYLNFSILDIISGNYEVNEVAVSNSELHLKRTKNGEDNYHFWQESDSEGNHFQIHIDQVNLTESKVYFNDQASETDLKLTAHDCRINAIITDETIDLSGDLNTQIHTLKVSEKNYLEEKSVSGLASLNINLSNDLYTFSNTALEINEFPIQVSGIMDLHQSETGLKLKTTTRGAELNELVNVLPEFVKSSLNGFNINGNFDCDLAIEGKAGGGNMPDVSGTYIMSNANIQNSNSGVSLDDISIQGSYSAPFKKEDLLTVSQFSCALDGDLIKGSGKLSRLSSPFINVETSGNIDLENLHDLLDFKQIEELEGRAQIELNYKGNLGQNWQPSAQNLRHADLSGMVTVQNGTLKLEYNAHEIFEISGQLKFHQGVAEVSDLKGIIETSDFKFDGKFNNVLGYVLLPEEHLKVTSTLSSNHLNLNSLLSSSGSESSTDYEFNLPSNIELSLNTSMKHLEFREFSAKNIATQANLNSKSLTLKSLKMELADGLVEGDFSALQGKNGVFSLNADGNVSSVNISKVFSNFEDFNQQFITHEHIKGTATSDFSFSASMTSGLDLVSESIAADANITLAHGELINHSTLQEIGQYIKDKKLLGKLMNVNDFQSKLNHVRFSELKESDALNIIAEGNHSFTNEIDYSVGFDVVDLSQREGLAEDEKGISKNIFISMKGSTETPVFSYDRLAVKENRKENRKEEVHKIRELVRQEFSDKKTKSTEVPKATENPKIKIDWSENKDKEEQKKPKKITLSEPDSEPKERDDDDDDDDDF